MEIIRIKPSGYCVGVIMALRKTYQAVKNAGDRPVYIMGMIVHNHFVVDAFSLLGAVTLNEKKYTRSQWLHKIDNGIVIFTAHGTDPALLQAATAKGLTVIDATCPDVRANMQLIQKHLAAGFDIIYLGVANHPEANAVAALGPRLHLITSLEDAAALNLANDRIMITNQTTMSVVQLESIISFLKEKYPQAAVSQEICAATRLRQQAVAEIKDCDTLIVVGDPTSNNTAKLAQQGQLGGIENVIKVESARQLDDYPRVFASRRLAITAGASTPGCLVDNVVSYLQTGRRDYQQVDISHILDDIR